ncbi:hypothetical protein ABZ319_12295 [Nocardia sp. NPDC005978]|uniref:hypothetical protein n=1 Tax=Nocardia sp. NPDC005978 TaxID=3156725 RepID=UPI0033B8F82C
MTVEPARFESAIHHLQHGDPRERFEACETFVDWIRALSPDQGAVAGRALAEAAVGESDAWAREAQFNALVQLWTADLIGRVDLDALARIPRSTLTAENAEHLSYLEEDFGALVSDSWTSRTARRFRD